MSKGFAWTIESIASISVFFFVCLAFLSHTSTIPLVLGFPSLSLEEKAFSFLDSANRFGSLQGTTTGSARLRISLNGIEEDREFVRANLKRLVSSPNDYFTAKRLALASIDSSFLADWCSNAFTDWNCTPSPEPVSRAAGGVGNYKFSAFYWGN
ncbi:MAG TPA: hypothetical protein VJI67_02640, partial [archaeon]|nr:hypothetical protein [archaeon]